MWTPAEGEWIERQTRDHGGGRWEWRLARVVSVPAPDAPEPALYGVRIAPRVAIGLRLTADLRPLTPLGRALVAADQPCGTPIPDPPQEQP